MEIRPLEQKDNEAVIALADHAFGKGFLDPDVLSPDDVYVAEVMGKVVGYTMKTIFKNEDEQTAWRIEQVVVDPDHRRKGVAETLITRVINDGISNKISIFESQAWVYNDTKKVPLATPLEACGFQRICFLKHVYTAEHGAESPCSVCGTACKCSAWLYRFVHTTRPVIRS